MKLIVTIFWVCELLSVIFNKLTIDNYETNSLIIWNLFILAGSHLAKACDSAHIPFSELLNHFDPRLHSAVEGYFISQKTFKVTKSYHLAIKV